MNTAGCILLNSDLFFVLFLRGAVLTFDYTDTPYCSCFWIYASQPYSKVISCFAHLKHCLIEGALFGLLGSAGSTGALTAENRHRPKAHFCVWKVTGWSSWIRSYETEPRKGWARLLFQTISNISNCHCAPCFGQLVTTEALNWKQ
jgi:hypothetical protein